MIRFKSRLPIALLVASTAVLGCSGSATRPSVPATTTHVGLTANPSDFTLADSIGSRSRPRSPPGVSFQMTTPLWNEIESTPGVVDIANQRLYLQVFRALGFASLVNLRPVDTTQRGTPSDLSSRAWDDPVMLDAGTPRSIR